MESRMAECLGKRVILMGICDQSDRQFCRRYKVARIRDATVILDDESVIEIGNAWVQDVDTVPGGIRVEGARIAWSVRVVRFRESEFGFRYPSEVAENCRADVRRIVELKNVERFAERHGGIKRLGELVAECASASARG